MLIAVEVLNNKSRYNTLELTSGRMAEVKKGDVVVGALGHRKALFGYSGHLPTAAQARRHRAAAESRRRDRHLRLDQSVARRAVRLPGARRRARLPVLGPARRRAGTRLGRAAAASTCHSTIAGRARGRDRRHLHELGQDRRRVRDREPVPPQRPRRRCVQVDGRRAAPRHPRDGGLGRAPRRDVLGLRHRARRRRRTRRRSRAVC